jgi:hypothetical protein
MEHVIPTKSCEYPRTKQMLIDYAAAATIAYVQLVVFQMGGQPFH